MRAFRIVSLSASILALTGALALFALPGCDGGGDGEQASPINKAESESQAKAYEQFALTKKGGRPPAKAAPKP
ncbi:hypothetical protein [Paludisphaera mucosa]|uniref:Lipoprotein n=1 Tax=Paludisphaera mucosa TaxID=3030827 RepID=A0ABT6FJW2_9BACT|nr:hypothetical protein [Paludisphaera mucosa]MDG3007866.1 hypothetical protein [Paludisphaera mucosa]